MSFTDHVSRPRPTLLGRAVIGALCSVVVGGLMSVASGQIVQTGGVASESNVKTAYIYGFGRYVTWPQATPSGDPQEFVIGILGDSDMEAPLQAVARKRQVTDRNTGKSLPIRLVRFDSVDAISACQILFIPSHVPDDQATAAMERLNDSPTLVIGESAEFHDLGGVVRFLVADGRVKFSVNISHATRRGLKVDAKLLKAAYEVLQDS